MSVNSQGLQQESKLPMSERRALFEQAAADAGDSGNESKNSPEQENENSENKQEEKSLSLKERMAKFGVPTDSAQPARPLPSVPRTPSNNDSERPKPLSPTTPDTPDSELQFKMNAFAANRHPPDPPMLSTLNSPLQTANTSPRNAPPGSPESEDSMQGVFAVAAKNSQRGTTPESAAPAGHKEGGPARSSSLKDRMANFTASTEQAAPTNKPTPQAVPAPSKTIAEKRAAFAASPPAEEASAKPSPAEQPKSGGLANRMAAFTGTSSAGSETAPADASPTVEAPKPSGGLAERMAAFSKPADSSAEPTKPDAALAPAVAPGSLAERKSALVGAVSPPEAKPEASAAAEQRRASSLANRMAAFGDKPLDPPAASDAVHKALPEAPKASSLADRMAAFSGAASASPPERKPEPADAQKPSAVSGRVATLKAAPSEEAAPSQEPAEKAAEKPAEKSPKAGSLADRMAAFSGAGSKESEKDAAKTAVAEPAPGAKGGGDAPTKGGGLSDRMAAFKGGGGAVAEPKQVVVGKIRKESAPAITMQAPKEDDDGEAKKSEEAAPPTGGGLSLKERMAALQQGSHSKSDSTQSVDKDKLDTKPAQPSHSQLKRGSAPAVAVPPQANAGRDSASGEPAKTTQSNTEASALSFWKQQQQQQQQDDAKPAAKSPPPPAKGREGGLRDPSASPDTPLKPPLSSREEADKKAEAVSAKWTSSAPAPSAAAKAANINPMQLTHQAREVMSALEKRRGEVDASQPAEEEAAEEPVEAATEDDGDLGVKNRASMFEQTLKGGYERDAAKAVVEPGRIWGAQKKEKAVESESMDVNDIKSKWQTGNVKTAESKGGAASEDALFRCHVAASTRTGGVAELQNKFLTGDFSEKQPEPKKSSKIAEIAETIHFDPNTLLPGAQHPNLNYNVQENTRIKDGWRDFNGGPRKDWDEDDEELPPPPTMAAR